MTGHVLYKSTYTLKDVKLSIILCITKLTKKTQHKMLTTVKEYRRANNLDAGVFHIYIAKITFSIAKEM